MKGKVEEQIQEALANKLADIDITDMCHKQQALEEKIRHIAALVDRPFDPERSVVVYGMKGVNEENLDTRLHGSSMTCYS